MPTALEILSGESLGPVPPVCVLYGDEGFLKHEALVRLRQAVLGDDDGQFALTTFEGKTAELRDVLDELRSRGLFAAGNRVIVVEDADSFVTRNRQSLEQFVSRPSPGSVLILLVDSWPSNTKLFQTVAETGGWNIECKVPTGAALKKWLIAWAKSRHDAKLDSDAAEQLLEIVGPELGRLDQELAKLAAAGSGQITGQMVDDLVAGWRTKTTWEMFDLALEGKAAEALMQLDHLLVAGESPIGLLAMISASLRKFAAAVRLLEREESAGRRPNLRKLLEQAGFRNVPFIMDKAEAQMRQIGRRRASGLWRQLLEYDLALKGGASSPARARMVLERLIVTLAAANTKAAG